MPVVLAVGWLVLACAVRFLPIRWRLRAVWGLVAVGVPILGWLTLRYGPGAGVLAFAAGAALLYQPARRVR
ncbi:DUF2484 family protein [Paracoccus sp. (in: a-proteobacteria)]|uniref:DUF2484 family protein n=1 Tax=Paracoccus sp. TaxID=267 RepID=UPI0026E00DD1|nr:DUF2484 family protein [Paracoccus sp. (in: a-proteobacteria)]MDO5648222.1 DUF2484 family protein [Paracoccus sp. (in: a-proteobacteria)]